MIEVSSYNHGITPLHVLLGVLHLEVLGGGEGLLGDELATSRD